MKLDLVMHKFVTFGCAHGPLFTRRIEAGSKYVVVIVVTVELVWAKAEPL